MPLALGGNRGTVRGVERNHCVGNDCGCPNGCDCNNLVKREKGRGRERGKREEGDRERGKREEGERERGKREEGEREGERGKGREGRGEGRGEREGEREGERGKGRVRHGGYRQKGWVPELQVIHSVAPQSHQGIGTLVTQSLAATG